MSHALVMFPINPTAPFSTCVEHANFFHVYDRELKQNVQII